MTDALLLVVVCLASSRLERGKLEVIHVSSWALVLEAS